ncbi:MAG: hypothetical protein J07AB43_02760 [Candidatus Nanosalina sp. J07AB43]|nr:MAG: hypothetical protein J07AB43_02760 [Candidatus Nanosalina sp. J07AB43]
MLDQLPPQTIPVVLGLIAILASYFGGKYKKGKLETNLRDLLRENDVFPSPEVVKHDSSFIEKSLKDNIDNYDESPVPFKLHTSDSTYYVPTSKATMKEAKTFNIFEYLPYRPDRFDCEDYAAAYMTFVSFFFGSNAVGTVYDFGAGHAYNIILYSDGSMELYEPQDGRVVEHSDDTKYALESGVIIF